MPTTQSIVCFGIVLLSSFLFGLIIDKADKSREPTCIQIWALSWLFLIFLISFVIMLFGTKKAEEDKKEAKISTSAEAAVGTGE